MLNILSACFIPAKTGYVAKTIDVAPRNPAKERNIFSFFLKLLCHNDRKTLMGRTMKLRTMNIINPLGRRLVNLLGDINNPRLMNIII